MSNPITSSPAVIVRATRSTVRDVAGAASTTAQSRSMSSKATSAVSNPCFPALPRKISPNRELITASNPYSHTPHTACSRLPPRVLAPRAGAKVGASNENLGLRVLRLVEHEGRVLPPGCEECVIEPGLGHPLEVDRWDNLIGVDV